MESKKEELALERTNTAMLRIVVAVGICMCLSYFFGLQVAAIGMLVLVGAPLSIWVAAEFKAWDQGGPAGDAKRTDD